jgi:triacylglycerol lipase
MGRQISVAIWEELRVLYAPLLYQVPDEDIRITRDVAYGPHRRHRLNVFCPRKMATTGDVVMFVHGGGFAAGDKEEVPQRFYDNVGNWAASHGMHGVTLNYRLAPDHRWPAGTEDVAASVNWVRERIGAYGVDPDRIFLIGHSAGAAHVAGYLASPHYWKNASPGIAGCICVSGIYDLQLRPVATTYFGDDENQYPNRSPLIGLAKSDVPLLVTVAENDPEFIQRHAVSLFNRHLDAKQSLPKFCQIRGHNHFSTLLHLNTPDTSLSDVLLSFIRGS